MKYKNKSFPFYGYHKYRETVFRFVEKQRRWFTPDLQIYASKQISSPPVEKPEHMFSETDIGSKFVEINDMPYENKKVLIRNILFK